MIHDPKKIRRIKREAVRRPRPFKRDSNPKLSEAIERGDAALQDAGIERQGGTSLARRAGEATAVTFRVGLGCADYARSVLQDLDLGVPFKVHERGPIKTQ